MMVTMAMVTMVTFPHSAPPLYQNRIIEFGRGGGGGGSVDGLTTIQVAGVWDSRRLSTISTIVPHIVCSRMRHKVHTLCLRMRR